MPNARNKTKTKLVSIQKDQNICKVGVATIVSHKNVNGEKTNLLASEDCNWSPSFTDLQVFTWIRDSILCERDSKHSCYNSGVRREAGFVLCGSSRCDFPLIGSHTPTGSVHPRATWSCLWTVLTPSALLFPSFPTSLHHFVCVCVLMQPSANTDASVGFDAADGL